MKTLFESQTSKYRKTFFLNKKFKRTIREKKGGKDGLKLVYEYKRSYRMEKRKNI